MRARRFLLALLLPALCAGCLCHSTRPDRPKNTLGYHESENKGYRYFPVTDAFLISAGHTPLVLFSLVAFPLDLVTWPLRHLIACPAGNTACKPSAYRFAHVPRQRDIRSNAREIAGF